MARKGNVAEMLVDLATGVAAASQEHIDAQTVTVDDVRDLLRSSAGSPAQAAPPAT